MSAPDWKDRFSEKQLERKRIGDKISQRRARQQSKRIVDGLEHRLRLLKTGQTATLINQIQQENACIRTKIWRYRYQMESIFVKGKECMLQDDPTWGNLSTTLLTRPPTQSPQETDAATWLTPLGDSAAELNDSPRYTCRAKLMKNGPSVFRELGFLLGCTSGTHTPLATNEILESVMMWRAKFSTESNEFAVLLSSHGLGQEPYDLKLTNVKAQALSKHLFHDIMQNILYGDELIPRKLQPVDRIAEEQISKVQYQRRAIAYCTYEMMRAWRDDFKSSLEYLAAFWAQYRYFLVIAFPTVENFEKCPAWRRPIIQQFNHDHPLAVDLILWPQIREKLVSTWDQYELLTLCVTITRSLQFLGPQIDIASALKLEEDSSDLILEESFERALHDVRNFTANGQSFCGRYPELAATLFTVDLQLFPALSVPSLEGASDQETTWPEWLEDDQQTTGLVDPNLTSGSPPPLSHLHHFDTSIDSAFVIDTEPSDSVGDHSTTSLHLQHAWNESLGDQELLDSFVDLGEQWVGADEDPNSLRPSDTITAGELDCWQRYFPMMNSVLY